MADIITKPEVKPFKFDYNVNAKPAVTFTDNFIYFKNEPDSEVKYTNDFCKSAIYNRESAIKNFNELMTSNHPSDNLFKMENNILIDTIKYSNAAIITDITYRFITSLSTIIKSPVYYFIDDLNGYFYIGVNREKIYNTIDNNLNSVSKELINSIEQIFYYSGENGSEYLLKGLPNYVSSLIINAITEIYYCVIRESYDRFATGYRDDNRTYRNLKQSDFIYTKLNEAFDSIHSNACYEMCAYIDNVFKFITSNTPKLMDDQK